MLTADAAADLIRSGQVSGAWKVFVSGRDFASVRCATADGVPTGIE